MTALDEYQRLEASGLWRATPDVQRTEVIVSIGDATLIITDLREQPLAHWSIPAVQRANPGRRPAIYHPDGDPGETLELSENEKEMVSAIEKLRAAVERRRPHPGRLRLVVFLASMAAVVALMVFWLPGAMRAHAVSVVPDVKRQEIGAALLDIMQRITGPACRDAEGTAALMQLAARLPAANGPGRIIVVRGGVRDATHLPGGTILVNRALVEDHEDPDVVAGYIIAERLRSERYDPLEELLEHKGFWASFQLLTTGEIRPELLQSYAQHLLTGDKTVLSDEVMLLGFRSWSVRSTPYAFAVDISGETTLGLIEADPFVDGSPDPVLSDANWVRLQGICGS
ncbi:MULTISPECIES: hypothetical protein [unclassified Roseovarius]|uniref:hypothetical protein n=1 Tax=unclassified Roseovarius TaxID=2614913 RepID=UPI00273DD368|nr:MULTISPECIES: hypothetical protein [unclassified Roseovarius]